MERKHFTFAAMCQLGITDLCMPFEKVTLKQEIKQQELVASSKSKAKAIAPVQKHIFS